MRYGLFVPLRRPSVFVFHLVLIASLIYARLFLQSPARLRLASQTLQANGVPTTSARTNLTKRLSDATYAEANQKGLSLRCLMAKNIEQTQSYQVADFLMDWENATTEGWVGVSNGEVPFFKHYLDQTFAALGTSGNSLLHHSISHTEGGLVFENPSDPSEEELDALTVNTQGNFESNGEVSGAQMYSSIDVTEGIFIADKSKTVQSSMKDLFGTNDWNEVTSALQGTNKKLTHFQRWSDVAFAQWVRFCIGHANIVGIILMINQIHRWMPAPQNRAMYAT
ncbi:hypothetical protein PG999_010020 [Apiospora kogelbergensis]|uniref:Uncharacterized protein n=1 Tax=Apiospora kogelbergensis TaxID=1337665 RepID=A0AAW0QN91_9PEZI